jgi:hypothetical protein
MNDVRTGNSQPLGGVSSRKPYTQPTFEVFGDVGQVTQNRGNTSLTDAGKNRGTHVGGGPR